MLRANLLSQNTFYHPSKHPHTAPCPIMYILYILNIWNTHPFFVQNLYKTSLFPIICLFKINEDHIYYMSFCSLPHLSIKLYNRYAIQVAILLNFFNSHITGLHIIPYHRLFLDQLRLCISLFVFLPHLSIKPFDMLEIHKPTKLSFRFATFDKNI